MASSTLAFLVAYAALAPLPYLLDDVAFYSAKTNHLRYDTPEWLKSWIDFQFYHEVPSGVEYMPAITHCLQSTNQSISRLEQCESESEFRQHFPVVDYDYEHDVLHSDRHFLGHLVADQKSTAGDGGSLKRGTASAQLQPARWPGLRSQLVHIGRGQQDAFRLGLALPLDPISGTLASLSCPCV